MAMNASLSQPVDARKNKPGDQVTAKTTEATKSEGRVVIPRGTKLIGHVTECKQRNKEEVSRRTLAVEGVLAVQAGDNPRVVREKLEAFLPLALRGELEPEETANGEAPAKAAA